MAPSPTSLWIGRLSLLLLVFSGCLADNSTTPSNSEGTSLSLIGEIGHQRQCYAFNKRKVFQICNSTTGAWCSAIVLLNAIDVDGAGLQYKQKGCAEKKNEEPFTVPSSRKLVCYKKSMGSNPEYACFCDTEGDRCNDDVDTILDAFYKEARLQYHAEFDPPTTTPEPTATTTTEEPVVTSAAANSSKTDGNEWTSTMASSTNNSLFLGGMAALFVILICMLLLLVIGITLALKWKKSVYISKLYGPFGIVRIDFYFLLLLWDAWDDPIEDEVAKKKTRGMKAVANSDDLVKGKEFEEEYQAKKNTRKAIVRETAIECKDDKGKKTHANYLNKEKTIIATLDPDPKTAKQDGPYFGSFVKMIVVKKPAVVVNLGHFNDETVNLLGDFENCPKQFVGERFGRFERRLMLKKLGNFTTRRSLQFLDAKGTKKEMCHVCEHITYNAWPEGGAASETESLTLLAAYVFEKYVSQNKLVVITSEHGCGRTGTFALALSLLKEADTRALTSKDVLRIGVEIRRARYTAIAGPLQFGFGISLALSVHAHRLRDKELRKMSNERFIYFQQDMTKELSQSCSAYETGRFKFYHDQMDDEIYEILKMGKKKPGNEGSLNFELPADYINDQKGYAVFGQDRSAEGD